MAKRGEAMEKIAEKLRLYLVTARYDYTDAYFLDVIQQACQNGVTMVQLREKTASTWTFYQLAQKVKEITDDYDIPLIINDRVDICLAVDAAGVHVGDSEMPVSVVRRLIGGDKILGVSAKSVARGQEAAEEGADYLGVGAMFPTKTKDTPLTSFATLKEMTVFCQLPIVAIGGIKAENIDAFTQIKLQGVAVVSEIMREQEVPAKVRQLRKLVDQFVLEGN